MYDYSLKIFLSFPSLQTLCLSWKRLPVSLHTSIYLEMHFPFVYSTKSHLHLCLVILLRAFAAISFSCSRNSDSLKLVVIYLLLTDAKKQTNKQTNKLASLGCIAPDWKWRCSTFDYYTIESIVCCQTIMLQVSVGYEELVGRFGQPEKEEYFEWKEHWPWLKRSADVLQNGIGERG